MWRATLASFITALAFAAAARGETFHSTTGEYTIEIPQGWVRIPDEQVQKLMGVMFKAGSSSKFQVDAAFQADGKADWFTYPYVMVQIIPYPNGAGQPTERQMKDMVAQFTGATLDKVKDQFSEPAQGLMKGIDVGKVTFDEKTQTYEGMIGGEVPGIGSIQSLLTGKFGNKRLIQINGSFRKDTKAGLDNIQTLAHSLRYDKGAEYQTSLPTWAIGALIGGGIGALSILFRKKKTA